MPKKILLVEDDADTRNYLTLLLQFAGYTVYTAEDGMRGIEQTLACRPDVILSDIHMPNLDGVEMIKRLRQMPEGSQIPILVISASEPERLQEALDAGATRAFYKLLPAPSLMITVSEMIH